MNRDNSIPIIRLRAHIMISGFLGRAALGDKIRALMRCQSRTRLAAT
jgi:hypothetical protein